MSSSPTVTETPMPRPSTDGVHPVGPRTSERDTPGPVLPIEHVDTLWLQVTGTLCNLACLHCFISCGPKNDSHEFMELDEVRSSVQWGREHGVREYYFTGGEPFMHPEIKEMIEATLAQGPLTILSNGILIDDAMASWLGRTFRSSRYSFDLRISLDGTTPEENDAIRGRKTFQKIIDSVMRLWEHGINPVITVTTCHAELGGEAGRRRFFEMLRECGLPKPRVKFLTPFKIGREERRAGESYLPSERLFDGELDEEGGEHLQCSSCRMVTSEGVYPCPILIEVEEARMGDSLDEAMRPIELNHPACYTCHVEGVSCTT